MSRANDKSRALLQRLVAGTLRPSENEQPSQKVVAVDCQMIRVRDGEETPLALARVTIVDFNGAVLLDTFVHPALPVVDYRTRVHGIRKHDLDNGRPFTEVRRLVKETFRGALLVGHSLELHLEALNIRHPSQNLRDTAVLGTRVRYGWIPPLKELAMFELHVTMQDDTRSSVEYARVAMAIYRKYHRDWTEPACRGDAFDPVVRTVNLLANLRAARYSGSPLARPKLGRSKNPERHLFL